MKTLKGFVSDVHEDLLYYEVESKDGKKTRVFLNLSSYEVPLMPEKGCNVTLSHPHALNKWNSVIALDAETHVHLEDFFRQLDKDFQIETRIRSTIGLGLWSLSYRRKSSRLFEDAFFLDKIIQELKTNLELNTDLDTLIGLVVLTLLKIDEEQELERNINVPTCRSQDFLPEQINQVYLNYIQHIGFATCIPGYYPSLENHFLVGLLKIDIKFNSFIIEDSYCAIPVIFLNNKLPEFTEGLVIIDTWTVFTELIFQTDAENKQFILVDLANVHLVKVSSNSCLPIRVDQDLVLYKNFKTVIYVTKRSVPIIGLKGEPQVWLDAVILDENNIGEKSAIFILEEPFFPVGIYLESEQVYVLQHNTKFPVSDSKQYPELYKKLKYNRDVFTITTNTVFTKPKNVKSNMRPSSRKTLLEARNLPYRDDIISFTGKIFAKKIPENHFKTFTGPRHNKSNYGIPGKTDTKITLTFAIDQTHDFVDLYFVEENNFQSVEILENMVVNVNHVKVWKAGNANKISLKSTPFTSFDIVRFDNDFEYRSVVPKKTKPCTWLEDRQYFTPLKDTLIISQHTIVQAILHIHTVLHLNWAAFCQHGYNQKFKSIKCPNCKTADLDFNVEASLLVSGDDSKAEKFKIITTDKSVLDVLFDLRQESYNKNRYEPLLICGAFSYEKGRNEKDCTRQDFTGETIRYLARLGGPKISNLSVKAVCVKTPYVGFRRIPSEQKEPWRVLYMEKLKKEWPDFNDTEEQELKQKKKDEKEKKVEEQKQLEDRKREP